MQIDNISEGDLLVDTFLIDFSEGLSKYSIMEVKALMADYVFLDIYEIINGNVYIMRDKRLKKIVLQNKGVFYAIEKKYELIDFVFR